MRLIRRIRWFSDSQALSGPFTGRRTAGILGQKVQQIPFLLRFCWGHADSPPCCFVGASIMMGSLATAVATVAVLSVAGPTIGDPPPPASSTPAASPDAEFPILEALWVDRAWRGSSVFFQVESDLDRGETETWAAFADQIYDETVRMLGLEMPRIWRKRSLLLFGDAADAESTIRLRHGRRTTLPEPTLFREPEVDVIAAVNPPYTAMPRLWMPESAAFTEAIATSAIHEHLGPRVTPDLARALAWVMRDAIFINSSPGIVRATRSEARLLIAQRLFARGEFASLKSILSEGKWEDGATTDRSLQAWSFLQYVEDHGGLDGVKHARAPETVPERLLSMFDRITTGETAAAAFDAAFPPAIAQAVEADFHRWLIAARPSRIAFATTRFRSLARAIDTAEVPSSLGLSKSGTGHSDQTQNLPPWDTADLDDWRTWLTDHAASVDGVAPGDDPFALPEDARSGVRPTIRPVSGGFSVGPLEGGVTLTLIRTRSGTFPTWTITTKARNQSRRRSDSKYGLRAD